MAESEFILDATLTFKGYGTPEHHADTIVRRIARELYLQFGGTVWIRYDGKTYDGREKEREHGQDVGVHKPRLDSEGVQRVDSGQEVPEVQGQETSAGT